MFVFFDGAKALSKYASLNPCLFICSYNVISLHIAIMLHVRELSPCSCSVIMRNISLMCKLLLGCIGASEI